VIGTFLLSSSHLHCLNLGLRDVLFVQGRCISSFRTSSSGESSCDYLPIRSSVADAVSHLVQDDIERARIRPTTSSQHYGFVHANTPSSRSHITASSKSIFESPKTIADISENSQEEHSSSASSTTSTSGSVTSSLDSSLSSEEAIATAVASVVQSSEDAEIVTSASNAETQKLLDQIDELQADIYFHAAQEEQLTAQVGKLESYVKYWKDEAKTQMDVFEMMRWGKEKNAATIKKLHEEKEQDANAKKELERQVQQLKDDIEVLEHSKAQGADGLREEIETLRLEKMDAEIMVEELCLEKTEAEERIETLCLEKAETETRTKSFVRKIMNLEKDKMRAEKENATLATENATLIAENAKLVALNIELVRQNKALQEENETLQAYANDANQLLDSNITEVETLNTENATLVARIDQLLEDNKVLHEDYDSLDACYHDLESQHHDLEKEVIALRPANDGLIQPRPLDFTGLGRANVRLLEDVARLQAQQEAHMLQTNNAERGNPQHAASTAVHDIVEHFAYKLRDISAIAAVGGDIAAEIIIGKVEELEAETEARLAEEKQKLFADPAPSTSHLAGSLASALSGEITIILSNRDVHDVASQFSEGGNKLFQLREQAVVRLCSDEHSLADGITSPVVLPRTPVVVYYAHESDEQSQHESLDASDGSSALGTPMPQPKSDLPEEDVFRLTEESVTLEDDGFELHDAPPCHLDERVSQWVHAEGEEEDIEAEDMITPSPTTYHLCDPHMNDLHGHNRREAAYESGEVF
jgi:hypothetical protein